MTGSTVSNSNKASELDQEIPNRRQLCESEAVQMAWMSAQSTKILGQVLMFYTITRHTHDTQVKTHSPTRGRLQAFGSDSSKSSNFLLWSIVKNLQTQMQLIQCARCGALLQPSTD